MASVTDRLWLSQKARKACASGSLSRNRRISDLRSEPAFSKLAIPYLPNNPPRWPETVDAVVKLVNVYANHARKHERMSEWIDRIGWPRFFKMTELPFTKQHIDDFKGAGETYKRSTHLKQV